MSLDFSQQTDEGFTSLLVSFDLSMLTCTMGGAHGNVVELNVHCNANVNRHVMYVICLYVYHACNV